MNLLEELRAQRELIQKHLAWLDKEIARRESDEEKNAEATGEVPATKPGTQTEEGEDAGVAEAHPIASEDERAGMPPAEKTLIGDDVLRAKIGCLIFFLFGTLLFLFFLFGLPFYLID